MTTLEPLQYFVGLVLVGLMLAVWGLWSWCLRLVKERDRYEHEATVERNKAKALESRVNELLGRNTEREYDAYRKAVLATYGNGRAAKK